MKKSITCLLMVIIIMSIFCLMVNSSPAIDVKDYIKDRFPSTFIFYLSSLEELDQYEKEFIDLLQELPEEEQEYYAKEVYRKKYFSLKILEEVNCAYAQHTRGLDYYACLGEYAKAIEAYKEAIRINPDNVRAYSKMAVAYANLGQYDQSIEAFKEAIRIDPDYAPVYKNMGVAYANLGEYEKAIEFFKKAIQMTPGYASIHYDLCRAYYPLARIHQGNRILQGGNSH